MKTLKFIPILLTFLATVSMFTSCKKDPTPTPEAAQDNIVGSWAVSEGLATVYSDGYQIYQGEMTTSGSMRFDNDNTGNADFIMNVLEENQEIKGAFTWEIDGFEILMDKGSEDESRWAIITDEDNVQELQFTYEDQENDMEVEFLLTLTRK